MWIEKNSIIMSVDIFRKIIIANVTGGNPIGQILIVLVRPGSAQE